jgi:predicted  nucleic acid-binding Zn-ribbon protein
MHKNCILLTQVYENESSEQGMNALEERFNKIDAQYKSVFNATKECNDSITKADEECTRIDQQKGKFATDLADLS